MENEGHSLVLVFDGFIAKPSDVTYIKLIRQKPFGEKRPKWGIYVAIGSYSFPIYFSNEKAARDAFAQAIASLGLSNPTASESV
jgi:hypothetical protein